MPDWKIINSTYGLYEASSDGLIRHVGFSTRRQQRVLTPVPNRAGYLRVCLWVNGARLNKSVHRLVAEAFHGPSTLQVNHRDGVKSNNRPDNLEYVTDQENKRHAVSTMGTYCGSANGRSKLTERDRNAIREASKDYGYRVRLAAQFSVSVGTIARIAR